MDALNKAIEVCTSVGGLADKLGIRQTVVSNWRKRGVPDDRCPDIEFATGGVVTVEQLAPGATWFRSPDAAWPHPGGKPYLDVVKVAAVVQEVA